jgi:hypothetical protein
MSSPFRVRISGPLSGFAAGFREELLAGGYSPGTAAKHLQLMAHLSRWMAVHDVGAAVLGRGEIERFVRERRVTHARLASARALTPLLAHLRGLGVVPAAGSREASTPAGELLDRYAEYLRTQRGLKASTIRNYTNHARDFLADRERLVGGLALATLDVAVINDYMLRESRRVSISSTQAAAGVLRSLLRFLHVEGPSGGWRRWSRLSQPAGNVEQSPDLARIALGGPGGCVDRGVPLREVFDLQIPERGQPTVGTLSYEAEHARLVRADPYLHTVRRRRASLGAVHPVVLVVDADTAVLRLHSTMHLYPIDGAAHDVDSADSAFSYRDANWAQVIVGVDPDPANAAAIRQWTVDYWHATHPYSAGGGYVNFLMDEDAERVQATYPRQLRPARAHQAAHDPDNVFRINQNIAPRA